MKTNEIAKVTRQSELARASALEAAGEHGDAAQVRAMVERDFPSGESMPRTAHDLLPGDTADKYKPAVSEYDQQAADFLSRNGLKFRATLSDSKTPAWAEEGEEDGHHYRVTISREGWKPDRRKAWEKVGQGEHLTTLLATDLHPSRNRLVFDFWGSVADARKLKVAEESLKALEYGGGHSDERKTLRESIERDIKDAHPSAYDVLACISGDAYTPETFADFCAEYGYESDSIKALQQHRRCLTFSRRLRAFFTEKELNELSEIQ